MRHRNALESAARQLVRLFPNTALAERAVLILREDESAKKNERANYVESTTKSEERSHTS
jgi:hypothetical protein